MKFERAEDVQERIAHIVEVLDMDHIDPERVVCFRSTLSKSDAQARIWSLPRIWQNALGVQAHYIVEVLAEKYDKLSEEEREKTLIHELMHISKKFTGSLVPHNCFGKRIDGRTVGKMHRIYKRKKGIKE
jgi:predicted metallopeptidase